MAVHAQMKPDSVAFRYRGADTTWAQLNRRIEALADALARRGVGQGDRVLVVMLNHTAYFEAVLGINAAGAIAVPVNFRLTPPEMSYIVSDSGAVAVITDATLAPLVAAVRAQNDGLGTCIVVNGETVDGETEAVLGYEEVLAEQGAARTPLDIAEDWPALIMYTSGTTGSPKGAILIAHQPHRPGA